MGCLTRIPTFRTFQKNTGQKPRLEASVNCANVQVAIPCKRDPITPTIPNATRAGGAVMVPIDLKRYFADSLAIGLHGRLPSGIVVSPGGAMSGTPPIADIGVYPLVANAMGVNGRVSSNAFTLTIT